MLRNTPGRQVPQLSVTTGLLSIHKSPRKLAFCITELHRGGAERALCELARRLDRNRFTVTVYSLQPRPENEENSCVPMLETAGIPVRFLGMRGKASFLSGFFRLRRLLKNDRPELLLTFLFHANFLGRLAARSVGLRHVVAGIRVAEHRQSHGARWHLTLDRWTSPWVERYVCVSRAVAEFSEHVGGLPAGKLEVIPNGVTVLETQPAVSKENRILYVGRLDEQKGLDWFFETVPRWLPNLPGWELWIAGDGPLRRHLTDLWLSPHFDRVRKRVKLLGWQANIPELMRSSRMLVLPSRWEGMPNVLLQAMSARLPVVAAQAEGVQEVLGNLAEDQIFHFGDEKTMFELLTNWASHPEQAEERGQANYERARDHFSQDATVARYERLFAEILG